MAAHGLETVLINTYNPNEGLRVAAEHHLQEFLATPGSLAEILRLVGQQTQSHRDVRLAAAILLKNNIRSAFRLDSEKGAVKAGILPTLFAEEDNSVKKILAECIRVIADIEANTVAGSLPPSFVNLTTNNTWPELLPSIIAQIQSSQPLQMYNALLALRHVVKRFEFKYKHDRQTLNDIIDQTFPLLQALFSHLATNNSIEAAHIMRLACKVFWACVHHCLPTSQVGIWCFILGTYMCICSFYSAYAAFRIPDVLPDSTFGLIKGCNS
jgi:hypothetical protein